MDPHQRPRARRFRSIMTHSLLPVCSLMTLVECALGQDGGPESTARSAVAPPVPPTDARAVDGPNDKGDQVLISWTASADDAEGAANRVTKYIITRGSSAGGPFDTDVGEASAGSTQLTDRNCTPGAVYYYEITAMAGGVESVPVVVGPVTPQIQYFNTDKDWFLGIFTVMSAAIIGFIYAAQSGVKLTIRRIPALESVDEAVGRATEMGRNCIFIAGIQDMDDIGTIAGISILSRVAKTAAEYGAEVDVPTSRSLVMAAARETVQGAYLAAGRPDAFNPDRIYYVSDEQFAFVAHVSGKMVRERPAACFYFGSFFAESLIFAEMGNLIGAIQIAGTREPAQLPFFVAACDYTLIGEEFFAASAYLSGEPHQLGSLKGQDMAKLFLAACVLAGVALATFASLSPGVGGAERAVNYMSNVIFSTGGGE